jgi:hypothetical protein
VVNSRRLTLDRQATSISILVVLGIREGGQKDCRGNWVQAQVLTPRSRSAKRRGSNHTTANEREGEETMARSATDFAEHNSDHFVDATGKSFDWLRELTQHNMYQTQAWLIAMRKVADALSEQESTVRQQSFAVAEGTLSNTLDFLQEVSRLKEPRELTLIQSEFVTRQAQVLGEGGRKLAQTIVHGTGEIVQKAADMITAEHQRSEAA